MSWNLRWNQTLSKMFQSEYFDRILSSTTSKTFSPQLKCLNRFFNYRIADLLVLPNHQLARRIVKLSLRANELSNAIQLSKEHVANVRNDKMKCIRLEKLNCQNRLKEQKKHYEEIVARHQNFIEQLIKDKAGLCEKVTQITRRIDSQNQAWEHRLKTEVERAKETAMAGEKIRRERWVRENTKKIKELTVKGLELEINKMTAQHKQEIEDMKKQNQIEIMKAVDETKSRFDKIERNIRDSYAEEREGAIERERKAIKDRYEKQMEDERKSFEQQRTRLIHEFECEKDRIYAEMREKEHQFELKREELINEKLEMLEDTKNTFKEKLKQREQKHEVGFCLFARYNGFFACKLNFANFFASHFYQIDVIYII